MTRDNQSLHLKTRELCDCYATTDPLKGMSDLPKDKDTQQAALKKNEFRSRWITSKFIALYNPEERLDLYNHRI